jgi:hypothetical protein
MKLELSEIFQKDLDEAQEILDSLDQLTPIVLYLLAVVIGITLRNYINFHLEEKTDKPLPDLMDMFTGMGGCAQNLAQFDTQTYYPEQLS